MNSIDKKICYLAESLLVKGEFLNCRRFNLPPLSIADIKVASICNKRTDRIVVEKIIASSIIDSHLGKNASTTYLVEVLAAVSTVSYIKVNELTVIASDSINSCEQPFTFTICHHSDNSFILLDIVF